MAVDAAHQAELALRDRSRTGAPSSICCNRRVSPRPGRRNDDPGVRPPPIGGRDVLSADGCLRRVELQRVCLRHVHQAAALSVDRAVRGLAPPVADGRLPPQRHQRVAGARLAPHSRSARPGRPLGGDRVRRGVRRRRLVAAGLAAPADALERPPRAADDARRARAARLAGRDRLPVGREADDRR